jgi:1,4-dihydroxy-2-naphthoyl-CoA hydrolase
MGAEMIWFKEPTVSELNKLCENTLVSHMDIKIEEVSDNTLTGSMPANETTQQPFGILHGGANCVLAETLGSIAANMVCDPKTHHAVGLNINTSHVKAVRNGRVKGVATPVHLGKTTHVWNIKTFNESDQLTSETQLTMMIVERL